MSAGEALSDASAEVVIADGEQDQLDNRDAAQLDLNPSLSSSKI